MRYRLLAPIVVALAGLVLSGCGSKAEDTVAAAESAAEAAAGESASNFNDADVTFAQNMIPHHVQAVEMAVVALDDARGASPVVKDLAQRIQGAQQTEVDLMSSWLKAWGKEEMPEMDGMDHSSMDGMEGMMTAEEMESLATSSGADFDKSWLEMMVAHHEGALTMAKKVEAEGANPEVKELAKKIVAAQEAEIAEMNGVLKN